MRQRTPVTLTLVALLLAVLGIAARVAPPLLGLTSGPLFSPIHHQGLGPSSRSTQLLRKAHTP